MSDDSAKRGTRVTWRPVAAHPVLASIAGSAGAVGVGAVLIPFREQIGSVNAALVMAAIIVLAAEFGGRASGAIVGVVGSVSFNVFHTQPYGLLVIEETEELIAALLLIAFGVLVGSWHRKPPA